MLYTFILHTVQYNVSCAQSLLSSRLRNVLDGPSAEVIIIIMVRIIHNSSLWDTVQVACCCT